MANVALVVDMVRGFLEPRPRETFWPSYEVEPGFLVL